MNEKMTIDTFCCAMFMTIYTCPFFAYLFGTKYTLVSAAFFSVWIVLIIRMNRGILPLKKQYCLVIVSYIIIFIICAVLGLGDARNAVAGYTIYWMFGFIPVYYLGKKQKKVLKYLLGFMLMVIGVTAITTIMGFAMYGIQSKLSGIATDEVKNSLNIGQYNYIYGIAILIPMLIALYLNVEEKKIRRFSGILALLLIITCFISGYTIALIITIISCLIYLVCFGKKNAVLINLALILVVVIALVNIEAIVSWIEGVNPHLASRLDELVNVSLDSDSDLASRLELMSMSFSTFLKNPLIGVGPYINRGVQFGIGEHSQLLDDMARFGVGALLLFVLFIRLYIKEFSQGRQKWYKQALKVCSIEFCIMSFLNPSFLLPNMGLVFLFILPGIGVFAIKE